jgi:hypothetical protein
VIAERKGKVGDAVDSEPCGQGILTKPIGGAWTHLNPAGGQVGPHGIIKVGLEPDHPQGRLGLEAKAAVTAGEEEVHKEDPAHCGH